MRELQIVFKNGLTSIYQKSQHDWVFDSKERVLYIHYIKDGKLISVTRIPFESFRYAKEIFKDEGEK